MTSVMVQLNGASQPIPYHGVVNVYEKGSLICVQLEGGVVHKYPIDHLFRIVEIYGYHGERSVDGERE